MQRLQIGNCLRSFFHNGFCLAICCSFSVNCFCRLFLRTVNLSFCPAAADFFNSASRILIRLIFLPSEAARICPARI
ncbi:MAG TPA: hypothetical protein DC049_14620 [Spirochaetia bacterium]|nr:hypothetical protein [Spirochaetia bacterium]